MTIVIPRTKEMELWRLSGGRRLVYGRRKTGKSFFVKEFTEWDEYYTVGSDGTVYHSDGEVSLDILKERLRRGEYAVIDEFHRLPYSFLEFLQHLQPRNLTLVTSLTFKIKELLGRHSPITGLFMPIRFSIISPYDILNGLKEVFRGKKLLEYSVYLSDPFMLQLDLKSSLEKLLASGVKEVPHITSEVFHEEERELTTTYLKILKAVSGRYVKFSDIASRVGSNIMHYLDVLVKVGVLKRVQIYKQKRHLYSHVSPVFDLYYWLLRRYPVDDVDPSAYKDLTLSLLPYHIEQFVERYLLDIYGGVPVKILKPEIDVAIMKNKRLFIVGEVKWKDYLSSGELKEIRNKLLSIPSRYRFLFVPDKSEVDMNDVRVIDVNDLLNGVKPF